MKVVKQRNGKNKRVGNIIVEEAEWRGETDEKE